MTDNNYSLNIRKIIKYLFFTILYLAVFCTPVFSQSRSTVIGWVVSENAALEFANVVLYAQNDTSKIANATVTDSLGHFILKGLSINSYILKIQMLGYVISRKEFRIESLNQNLSLDQIELLPDITTLNSVEVVGQKNILKKTESGFIIQTSGDISQASGTATDLLRNTPTVVVDEEGSITLRGKSPMILINGRNSALSNTDRIPASSVESIEIINNPSAKYDADAESGIISIKLKKNIAPGTNGSLAIGAGYGAKGRLNSAFIVNHRTKKWNLGLSYDNRFAGRTRDAEAERINYHLPDEYYLIQKRHDDRSEQTQNIKLNLDFSPDKKNLFSLEILGNLDIQQNYETLVSIFETQGQAFNNKNSRYSDELANEKAIEAALTYSRKFIDKRKHLDAALTSSFNFDKENTDISTQSLDSLGNAIGEPFLQRTYDYQNSNVSNLSLDYVQPIGKKAVLETGYKGILRITDVDFQSSWLLNNEYLPNPLASNLFHFNEQVHGLYLIYKNSIGSADSPILKFDIGLRGEQTWNHGNTETKSISFKNSYFNLFPSGSIAWYLKPNDFFKFTFGRRINRPSLGQLNPFIDITDSLNPHGGNPYLKPELISSFEFGYNREWKKISTTSNLFYRYSTDIIRTYISVDSNGIAMVIPMNYGSAVTYGFEEILSAFPVKWWSFNLSFSVYQQIINGENVNIEAESSLVSWYTKFINNFTLWKGGMLQFIINYNSPIATPQGTRIATYYIDGGFRQKLFKGKGAVGFVVTDIFNTLKSGFTAFNSNFDYHRSFKVDTRAALVTFTWSFNTHAKEELLENKFSNE